MISPGTLVTLAQVSRGELKIPENGLTSTNFGNGIRVALGIAGGIALIVVAYGGLKFVLSQGNPQETNKARNTIIDGMIGLAIIVTAFGVVSFAVGYLNP